MTITQPVPDDRALEFIAQKAAEKAAELVGKKSLERAEQRAAQIAGIETTLGQVAEAQGAHIAAQDEYERNAANRERELVATVADHGRSLVLMQTKEENDRRETLNVTDGLRKDVAKNTSDIVEMKPTVSKTQRVFDKINSWIIPIVIALVGALVYLGSVVFEYLKNAGLPTG